MSGIRVQFGSVVANDDVDLDIRPGEIHALLGENGAGKTTLMRVLAGLLRPQSGRIAIDGRPVRIGSPLEASALGIGMVHQHFMLVPTLTVAQNVALGLPGLRRWFPDIDAVARRLAALGRDYGLDVDPELRVGDLSVAGQQRAEILKQLYRGAKFLVLDEPTAVLTPQEADRLFEVLRTLAAGGTSIVFISHKLREVLALTDRITVLRAGGVVGRLETRDTTQAQIARLMVGDTVVPTRLEATVAAGPAVPLLEVEALLARDPGGRRRLDDIGFTLHAGEILGVAGVDGNGQQELAEALVGLRPIEAGSIRLSSTDISALPVAARLRAGMAHIPEDRHRTAIFDAMSIADNIAAERVGEPGYGRRGLVDRSAVRRAAQQVVAAFVVRCAGIDQPIGMLSGGNQQKVVLGRALSRQPKVVIAVQPTRGLDIGATAFLQRQLLERRAAGAGILLISMELDELRALSDRIMVMFKGAVVGILARDEVTTERLGLMMAGEAA